MSFAVKHKPEHQRISARSNKNTTSGARRAFPTEVDSVEAFIPIRTHRYTANDRELEVNNIL